MKIQFTLNSHHPRTGNGNSFRTGGHNGGPIQAADVVQAAQAAASNAAVAAAAAAAAAQAAAGQALGVGGSSVPHSRNSSGRR